jgi:hypothetical protein
MRTTEIWIPSVKWTRTLTLNWTATQWMSASRRKSMKLTERRLGTRYLWTKCYEMRKGIMKAIGRK